MADLNNHRTRSVAAWVVSNIVLINQQKKLHVFCNKRVKSLSHASTAHVDSTILAMLKPLANEEKFKQRRHDVSANKI